MATHPTRSEEVVKVRAADPSEAAVIRRYEALRARPDSPEKREATAALERLCASRGPLATQDYVYSYDRAAAELYRNPKAAGAGPGAGYAARPWGPPRAGLAGTRGRFSQRKGG